MPSSGPPASIYTPSAVGPVARKPALPSCSRTVRDRCTCISRGSPFSRPSNHPCPPVRPEPVLLRSVLCYRSLHTHAAVLADRRHTESHLHRHRSGRRSVLLHREPMYNVGRMIACRANIPVPLECTAKSVSAFHAFDTADPTEGGFVFPTWVLSSGGKPDILRRPKCKGLANSATRVRWPCQWADDYTPNWTSARYR